jgi:hypothetical protein
MLKIQRDTIRQKAREFDSQKFPVAKFQSATSIDHRFIYKVEKTLGNRNIHNKTSTLEKNRNKNL